MAPSVKARGCAEVDGEGRGGGSSEAGIMKFEGEKSLYVWITRVLGPSKIVKIPFF